MTLAHFLFAWLIVIAITLFGWVFKIIINALNEEYNLHLWEYIVDIIVFLGITGSVALLLETIILEGLWAK